MEYKVVASMRKGSKHANYKYRCYDSETKEIFNFTLDEINQLKANGHRFIKALDINYDLVIPNEGHSLQDWCNTHGERGQRLLEEIRLPYGLTTYDFSYSSEMNVEWKCNRCNNLYLKLISRRTINNSNCGHCSNQRVSNSSLETTSLRKWCDNNGEFGKRLMKEILLTDGYTIDNISYGSHKRVRFRCEVCNKIYSARLCDKTSSKSGCPYCNDRGTSFPEQFIYWALKQIYTNTENRKKIEYFEIDIYIPELNYCIEYNGQYYHSSIDKWVYDDNKENCIKDLGYRYLRIEEVCDNDKCTVEGDTIYFYYTSRNREERLKLLVKYILEVILKVDYFNRIDFKHVVSNSYRYSKGAELEKSTASLYPELLEEYKPELNANVALNRLSPGSHFRAIWTCKNCGKLWETEILRRVLRKSGCSKCGYNIFTKEVNKHAIQIKAEKSLLEEYPFLEEEYKLELNDNEDLNNYTRGSRKRINWKCSKCGYIWDASLNNRSVSKTGCPNCHRNIFKDNGYFRDERAKERYIKQHPETFPIIDIVEENEA